MEVDKVSFEHIIKEKLNYYICILHFAWDMKLNKILFAVFLYIFFKRYFGLHYYGSSSISDLNNINKALLLNPSKKDIYSWK